MNRLLPVAFVALLLSLPAPALAGAPEEDMTKYSVQVVIGEMIVEYDYAKLEKMAKRYGPTMRATKTVVGVPLLDLIKQSQTRDRKYSQVVVLSDERTLIFEGDDLAHLEHLLLKLGDNHAAIMADSPESFDKMRAVIGKPRFKSPRKIYVYEIAK